MKNMETLLAQIGNRSETVTGTVNPPVYFSTAYRHEGIGQSTGFDYIRTGNPTRKIVEEAIAKLEGGDQGYAFSSGMAAIQTVMTLFESGDEFLVSADLYGGTYRLFEKGWRKYGLSFHYVDFRDISLVENAITEKTKAIFFGNADEPAHAGNGYWRSGKASEAARLVAHCRQHVLYAGHSASDRERSGHCHS